MFLLKENLVNFIQQLKAKLNSIIFSVFISQAIFPKSRKTGNLSYALLMTLFVILNQLPVSAVETNLDSTLQPGAEYLKAIIKSTKVNSKNNNTDSVNKNDISDELDLKEIDYKALREQIRTELKESYNPSSINYGSAMQGLIKQPVKNSRIFLPDTCVSGSFITISILDNLGDPQSYIGIKIDNNDFQSDYTGQVVTLLPVSNSNSLKVYLLNDNYSVTAKLIPGQAYVSSVEQPSPIIEKLEIYKDHFDVLKISGKYFDGIGDHNHVYIDDIDPAQILSASPIELKIRIPKSLDAGNHYIHVSTNGTKSNQQKFSYFLK